jgi:guanylate kinase
MEMGCAAGKGASSEAAIKGYKALVIVGPSGVGKGTLIKRLIERYPNLFALSVSYTIRAPREGETDGVQYHFTTKEKFLKMVEDDEFIEHAIVHEKMYGTAKCEIHRIRRLK